MGVGVGVGVSTEVRWLPMSEVPEVPVVSFAEVPEVLAVPDVPSGPCSSVLLPVALGTTFTSAAAVCKADMPKTISVSSCGDGAYV